LLKKIFVASLFLLLILLIPESAWAADSAWTGAVDGAWTNADNWTSGVPGAVSPTINNGDTVTFNNDSNTTVTVDAWRNLENITFGIAASPFTLTSGVLHLTDEGTLTNSAAGAFTQTISSSVVLEGDYIVDGAGTTEISGVLSGAGGLVKNGSGTLILSGDNSSSATGGTITTDGSYKVHTFNLADSGTNFSVSGGQAITDVLVVGGGGGGGSTHGGGGGGGGLIYQTSYTVTGDTAVIVGDGGAGGAALVIDSGDPGEDSSFGDLVAFGAGGGGGGWLLSSDGGDGGSGGGGGAGVAAADPNAGGAALDPQQGNNGGSSQPGGTWGANPPPAARAGGGGGAGEAGTSATGAIAGDGGDGLEYSISGVATYYAGGGGGGSDQDAAGFGSGGQGGGGAGSYNRLGGAPPAENGVDGTGGGGGGGGGNSGGGGDGGSGIVIVRYLSLFSGNITINAGTLQVGNNGTTGTLGTGSVINNATLAFYRSDDFSVSNAISGSGDLIKQGAGRLTLTGVNLYTGSTTVNTGTLAISGGNNRLPVGTALILADTAGVSFDLNNLDQAIGSLSGGGATGGNVALGSGALSVGNAASTEYSGSISGTGTLEKTGAGTLTLSGSNSFSGGTTISAGKLQVAGANAAGTGALVNNATLDLGTTDLSVGGAYSQSGAGTNLDLTANSATDYGKITSTASNASVADGSTINVTVGGYIPNNATLSVINAAAGSTYGAATVNSSSPFVTLSAAALNGNFILTASRASSGFAGAAGNSNAQKVGQVLDNIVDPSADMTTILDTLDSSSSSVVASSLATMYPTADRGVIAMTNESLSKFAGAAVLRLQDSKMEKAENESPALIKEDEGVSVSQETSFEKDIWLQTYGNYARQNARGSSNGYLGSLWGIIVGFDRGLMEDSLRVGAAQGFSESRILSKDSSGRTSIKSYQTGLYGQYDDQNHPYVLDAVLTYGYNDYDSSRNVSAGAINRTARSNYSGQQVSGYLEGGYKIKTRHFDIIPLAAIDYTRLHIAGYTESGAGAMDLRVDSQDYDTLHLGVGFRISRAMETENMLFTPEFRLRYFYAPVNDPMETLASFAGGGSSFQTRGFRPASSSLALGIRLEFFNKKNVTVLADLDSVLKDGYYDAGGSLTVKYSF